MGYGISYIPRTTSKSQVLAYFVTEWTQTKVDPTPTEGKYWVMYFDGSPVKEGANEHLIFISPLGEQLRYTIQLHFQASNKMTEYETLVNGLLIAIELGIQCLDIWGDS
jgi:ribonuclease HI